MHLPPGQRRAPAAGALAVVTASVCVQVSAAIAVPLFHPLGATAVAGLRQLWAAGALLIAVRPRLAGRSGGQWARIVVYGLSMATMNVAFYNAVARLPLGVAATLLFLGPFAVAAAGVASRWELALPVAALAGVVLVSHPGASLNWPGLGFGLLSAAALACYTVFAQHVGDTSVGLDGVALSVLVAAASLLPFSIPAASQLQAGQVLRLAGSGLLGGAVGFTLDFLAVRLASAKVVATLFSVDPVVAALVGVVLLGQSLPAPTVAGIALIVAAGTAVIWRARPGRITEPTVAPHP